MKDGVTWMGVQMLEANKCIGQQIVLILNDLQMDPLTLG